MVGLLLTAVGLLAFARAPVNGSFLPDVVLATFVLGLGAGSCAHPVAAHRDDRRRAGQAGLASGLISTANMIGGALGLAILASVAGSRTASLVAGGDAPVEALNGGYQLAFVVGAVFAAAGGLLGGLALRIRGPVGAMAGDLHGVGPADEVTAELTARSTGG